jgi:hypothetical protein
LHHTCKGTVFDNLTSGAYLFRNLYKL